MPGGIDGKEEIISSKRIFRNCLSWRTKRHVENPIVNAYVRGRVRFFLLVVSVLIFDARRMFVVSWCVSFVVIKYLLRSYQ
jgi:hypothetical protein